MLTAAGIRAVAQSPHLPHLTELILDTAVVDLPMATALTDSPLTGRLKWITFRDCDRIDPDARCLPAEKFPRQLMIADRVT